MPDPVPSAGLSQSCAGAIFFENPSGVVLGANFMKGRDVIFDAEERRVGFAKADCGFDAAKASATPTAGADAATPAPSTAAVVPATTEPAVSGTSPMS